MILPLRNAVRTALSYFIFGGGAAWALNYIIGCRTSPMFGLSLKHDVAMTSLLLLGVALSFTDAGKIILWQQTKRLFSGLGTLSRSSIVLAESLGAARPSVIDLKRKCNHHKWVA